MDVGALEELPLGKGIVPSNDPEIFVGLLELEIIQNRRYIRPPALDSHQSPTTSPAGQRGKHSYNSSVMSYYGPTWRNERFYISSRINKPVPRAPRYRQGTPYPNRDTRAPNFTPRPQPVPKGPFDILHVVVNVASAGTTPEIAAVIREKVASMSVHERAILSQRVQYRPSNFYREIDIVKRTANSANNATSTSHSDMTAALVAALNSLLILNNTPAHIYI